MDNQRIKNGIDDWDNRNILQKNSQFQIKWHWKSKCGRNEGVRGSRQVNTLILNDRRQGRVNGRIKKRAHGIREVYMTCRKEKVNRSRKQWVKIKYPRERQEEGKGGKREE